MKQKYGQIIHRIEVIYSKYGFELQTNIISRDSNRHTKVDSAKTIPQRMGESISVRKNKQKLDADDCRETDLLRFVIITKRYS